jgi:DNA-binding NarL/FixJ family response regulator
MESEKKNCLIIDDHLLIIDGYKNALKYSVSTLNGLKLNVDYATDCDGAIRKMNFSKSRQPYDIVILDLSLPPSEVFNIKSGEELGSWIIENFPDIKLLVITGYDSKIRINNVLEQLRPHGFLLKKEISNIDLVNAVRNVLNNKTHYSQTIVDNLRFISQGVVKLDKYSSIILRELSNGTKTKDLCNYVPLSISSIEKRKRELKTIFQVENDRDLIITARNEGII